MSRLSKPKTAQEFVSSSPLERNLALPDLTAPPAPEPAPELNSRVMKQLNFDLPEPEHHALKALVASMPNMSVRKFIVAAIRKEMEWVKNGA